MNKQDNKLAVSVVATLTVGIALIYTLMMYRTIIFAVAGVSILFLITAFILTQNIIAFITMRNKSMSVQIKTCVDDLSNQLEAMNHAQTQLGKATYVYTRQAAQMVTMLEGNYTESQEALYKNLAALTNTQNKATKLMIKYDQTNTTKLIASIKDMRNKLSETMISGFDQIQPNNEDVVATLESIVAYLKSQENSGDQLLSMQLSNVAQQLQNISNSIQHAQFTQPGMVQAAPAQSMVAPVMPAQSGMDNSETFTKASPQETSDAVSQPAADDQESYDTATSEETLLSEEASMPNIEHDFMADEMDDIDIDTMTDETIHTDTDSGIPANDIAALSEEMTETIQDTEEDAAEEIPAAMDKNANDMLSPDEIAALFTAAEPAPKKPTESEEEQFTPTFTVVGKSEETLKDDADVPTLADIPDDPNKQLSPDEIEALFASADPAPKKEHTAAPEPVIQETPSDDPGKQLSPDEIAALFAAAEPTPKKEPAPAPVSDDPNKQLSPDEIAALFASMG